ncbi:MAG: exo-alpha-sialidase [Oligosphaeraceae bacterium]|nr:exo-alpha-sialidase [Oligosphaeraceae bacterium]
MKIVSVKKVYANGKHNAFTGLGYVNGRYVLAFRQSDGHGDASGKILLLESGDGKHWTEHRSISLPEKDGISFDFRDSYFLSEQNRLLFYHFFTPVQNGKRLPSVSQVMSSTDGRSWSAPTKHESILWHPVYAFGKYYTAGYFHNGNEDQCDLFSSANGINWEKVARIAKGSETAIYPWKDGTLLAFVRTEIPPYFFEIFQSTPPFTDWKRLGTVPKIIQAPHVFTAGSQVFLSGRERPDYMKAEGFGLHRTKIWKVGADASIEEVLELPSAGDNAYTGTVVNPDGTVLMSYYSQHETGDSEIWRDVAAADIFIAHLKVD